MNRELIDTVKKEMIENARIQNKINNQVEVSGERHILPLKGRDIQIVFYSVKRPEAPLLVCMHGGGFLYGGCALNDNMFTTMRDLLDVNIVSVGYRKTPDFMFPCALNDVYDTVEYLYNDYKFGFDRENISIFGSSAGANLAVAACILGKQKGTGYFKNQILVYPYLNADIDKEKADAASIVFNELYSTPEETKTKLVSPVYAKPDEIEGLPPAVIVTAENDILRADGEKYQEMLKDVGIESVTYMAKGMEHVFFEKFFMEESSETVKHETEKSLEFINKNYRR